MQSTLLEDLILVGGAYFSPPIQDVNYCMLTPRLARIASYEKSEMAPDETERL